MKTASGFFANYIAGSLIGERKMDFGGLWQMFANAFSANEVPNHAKWRKKHGRALKKGHIKISMFRQ